MFMPAWACRTSLELVAVRVEQLYDITEDDSRAEGMETVHRPGATLREKFLNGFSALNAHRRVSEPNPWVWVLSFRPVIVNFQAVLGVGSPSGGDTGTPAGGVAGP